MLRVDDMLVVKRLIRESGSYVIRSDNPAYVDIRVDGAASMAVIGRVLWCGRRLV